MIRFAARCKTTLFVAMRQLWERKLLNGIATGGVTLGVLVLIAMNGIMLGFQEKFTSAILKISPHVTLFDTELRPQASLLMQRYEKGATSRPTSRTRARTSANRRSSAPTRDRPRAPRRSRTIEAAAPSLAQAPPSSISAGRPSRSICAASTWPRKIA